MTLNCEDINDLSPLWHAGELDVMRLAAFRAHLDRCAHCTGFISQQVRVDDRVRRAFISMPAEAVAGVIQDKVRHEIGRTSRRLTYAVAACAAALVIFAGVEYRQARAERFAATSKLFASVARDHRIEVIEHAPKPWQTEPSVISALLAGQGISEAHVQALAEKGYKLDGVRLCKPGGAWFIHVLYSRGVEQYSVYLRSLRTQASEASLKIGPSNVTGFENRSVEGIVVTGASARDCEQFARIAGTLL